MKNATITATLLTSILFSGAAVAEAGFISNAPNMDIGQIEITMPLDLPEQAISAETEAGETEKETAARKVRSATKPTAVAELEADRPDAAEEEAAIAEQDVHAAGPIIVRWWTAPRERAPRYGFVKAPRMGDVQTLDARRAECAMFDCGAPRVAKFSCGAHETNWNHGLGDRLDDSRHFPVRRRSC